jgi:ribonuclease P protein component
MPAEGTGNGPALSSQFTQKNRLKKKKDFDRVFREGKVRHTVRMIIHIAPNGLGHNRLGLVVKKTSTAVLRNRIKRLLREAFRLTGNNTGKGYDVVIIPRRNVELRLEELKADFAAVLGAVR